MKRGDTVIITDGSYTRSVVGGKLVHEFLNYGDEQGKRYTIIEVNCRFPLTDSHQSGEYRNDTVIQAVDSGKIVFIHHRFLQPAYRCVCIDGYKSWVSHEVYIAIKRKICGGN